jgi:hypothetical protein
MAAAVESCEPIEAAGYTKKGLADDRSRRQP